MKRTILLALLALLPFLAPAAGTATVRVTNSGTVPITVAGQTIRPSATASIAVPAGEAGALAAAAPDGFGLSLPASYPSIRAGGTFALRLSTARIAKSNTSPATSTSASLPQVAGTSATRTDPSPPLANNADGSGTERACSSFEQLVVGREPAPDQLVRVELKSRQLDFRGGGYARSLMIDATGTDAARHDHVFVYDKQGNMVDNIGWTGASGESGTTFRDGTNERKYGASTRKIEMTWGEYKAALEAFLEQTSHWNYELANAATSALREAVTESATVALSPGGFGLALVNLKRAARDIVHSSDFSTPMPENDVPEEATEVDLSSVDSSLRACYPGVNCQLWADQFFEYLEYVKRVRDESNRTKAEPLKPVSPSGLKPASSLNPARKPQPTNPAAGKGFRVRRVPADEADLLVFLDDGSATKIGGAPNLSFGTSQYALLNRTGERIKHCVVAIGFAPFWSQEIAFEDIPPGESRRSEDSFIEIGASSGTALVANPFLFPCVILVERNGRTIDLYKEGNLPTVGFKGVDR